MNHAAASAFGRNQYVLSTNLLGLLKLLVHIQRIVLKINAIPGQSQDLTLPHPGKQRHTVDQFIFAAFDRLQKSGDFLLFHRMDLLPANLWQIAEVRRIAPYHSQLHSLLQWLALLSLLSP